ncbi:MAG: hypothetical protein ACXVA8_11430, partial [Bdellovibrionota bacterium]
GAFANKDKVSYEGAMKNIPHATVTFNNGSNSLSETNRAILRNLVHDASARHAIAKANVAAWSDKALPLKGEDLLESDRNLAKERSDAISLFLKDELNVGNVDTFNMAETSNWLARTFKTEDAELKSVFSKKGALAPVSKAEFQIIKNEGGPSAAVVILERAEK